MVWSQLLPKKSLVVIEGDEWVVSGRLVYSPGPGLCPLFVDLLDLTWDLTSNSIQFK